MCQTKMCPRCKEVKKLDLFYKLKSSLDGLAYVCKDCHNSYYTLKKKTPKEGFKYCSKCKIEKLQCEFNKNGSNLASSCKTCQKVYRDLYKTKTVVSDKIVKTCTKCGEEKEIKHFVKDASKKDGFCSKCNFCINKWRVDKYKNDNLFKITYSIRRNVTQSFKRGLEGRFNKNTFTENILKLSFIEVKSFIESQFLSWMSWDNYGSGCGNTLDYNCSFDIDHIIPISYAKTEEDIYILNHWSNFQPLCSKINRDIKKAKVYPCTNLELMITFWEDHYEYINLEQL